MTVATCVTCGTRTDPGVACTGCGTPVPADARDVVEAYGERKYWESIQEKLTHAAAPKYHVTGLLGYGGMAGVFAAYDPRLGRQVAMKVLPPALMVDATLVKRFMQEARTIAQLSHPNIVAIHEVDERDDLHWFAMTYVPGRTLGQVMAETVVPIPVSVVRAWLHQIGDALAFAHAHGIVHRDIKPSNVLLDLHGNAMVTDFGIAKLANVELGLTRTGLLVGTPTYMSPEQCFGGAVTAASDQYSLGAMLYELLTWTAPFRGPTLAVLQAHVSAPPRAIRDLRPACPDGLAASIHRMLEKRPEDRWPSLAAALAAAGATPPGFNDRVRVQIQELAATAARLTIEPRPRRLLEGSRERVRLTVSDSSGRVLADRRIEWRSSRSAVAVVAADALLALSPGSTELTATCGGVSLSFEVTVEADPIGAVAVTPAATVIHAGDQVLLEAAVSDLDGSRLDGRAMLWSTSDPAVARVSAAGLVTAVAPGNATIAAQSGGKHAAAQVIVTTAAAASPLTVDERSRGTPVSDGVAPPQERDAGREEPVKQAWRHRAMRAADAAIRARDRTMPALMRVQRRGVVIAGAVAHAFRRAVPALTGRRRRAAVIAAGATLLTMTVTVVIGLFRMLPPGVGGQPSESVPPAEPMPGAPTAARGSDPTRPAPGTPPPDDREAPPDTGPAAPAPAANARILAVGDLPARATVVVSGPTGRTWPLTTQPIALAPGRYVVTFHAPGYESVIEDIVLSPGRTERWTPHLRPVRPAQPAPAPSHRAEADQGAVLAEVEQFVASFDRRDVDVVVPLLPDDEREAWRRLLENDDVTDFSATLAGVTQAPIEGTLASISFTVTLSYDRNQNEGRGSHVTFFGYAARRDDGWRLYGVEIHNIREWRRSTR